MSIYNLDLTEQTVSNNDLYDISGNTVGSVNLKFYNIGKITYCQMTDFSAVTVNSSTSAFHTEESRIPTRFRANTSCICGMVNMFDSSANSIQASHIFVDASENNFYWLPLHDFSSNSLILYNNSLQNNMVNYFNQ